MKNFKKIVFEKPDKLTDSKIQLIEQSGSVSPKFQYLTDIVLKCTDNKITLNYKDQRVFIEGKPSLTVNIEKEISPKSYETILRKLLSAGNLPEGNVDFVGSAKTKVGISFNYLTIDFKDKFSTKIDYILSDMDKKEFKHYAKIIKVIKNLKDE
jgi:hypothetical protein